MSCAYHRVELWHCKIYLPLFQLLSQHNQPVIPECLKYSTGTKWGLNKWIWRVELEQVHMLCIHSNEINTSYSSKNERTMPIVMAKSKWKISDWIRKLKESQISQFLYLPNTDFHVISYPHYCTSLYFCILQRLQPNLNRLSNLIYPISTRCSRISFLFKL